MSDDLVAPLPERDKREARTRLAVMRIFASAKPADRICRVRFFLHPREITGQKRIEAAGFSRAESRAGAGKAGAESIACGLLIKAAGYRGSPVAGLPFDADAGVVPTAPIAWKQLPRCSTTWRMRRAWRSRAARAWLRFCASPADVS